jgi:2-oxoisovalerate dehydrogenase E1 component
LGIRRDVPEGEDIEMTLERMYRFMSDLREFEEYLESRMGEFECSVHLCIGQESVPAALNIVLKPEDWLFSSHRNHGHYLAKGGNKQTILDEIEFKNGKVCGSQCFSDNAINFHASAIVGQSVGIAAGVAASGRRVFCCIGDAATEQGVFWEAMNYIALKNLPLVVICENNGVSIDVPIAKRQARPIAERVHAFGVRSEVVSGDDPVMVYHAIDEAANSRSPRFVEVMSVLQCPHMGAREVKEVDLKYCPIESIRQSL